MEEVSAKTCRLCLDKNDDLNNVFEKSLKFRFSPAELMCEMLHLVVSPDPNYPQKVCDECLKKMIGYKWFKDKCHRSWKFIEKFISEKCAEKQRSNNLEQSGPCMRTEQVMKHNVRKHVKRVPSKTKPKSRNVKYIREEIYLRSDLTEANILPENEEEINSIVGIGEDVNPLKIEEVPLLKEGDCATTTSAIGTLSNIEDKIMKSTNEGLLPAGCAINPALPIIIGNVYSLASNEQIQVGGSSLLTSSSANEERRNEDNGTKNDYEVVEETCVKRKRKKVVMQIEPFECLLCHKKLNSKDGYQLHMTRHGWETGSYWPIIVNHSVRQRFKLPKIVKAPNPRVNGNNSHKKKKVDAAKLDEVEGGTPKKVTFDCDYCSKSFETQNEMLHHGQIHMGKYYICDICNQIFKTKNMYNQHMNFHETGLRFSCFKCNASFADKASMKAHRDTHRAPRRFGCLICNKSFTSLNFLKKHMLVHDMKGDYQCNECDKSFLTKMRLRCHMRSHRNQTFICDLCQKLFKDKWRLVRHIYVHLDYRPLKCKYCDKGFITPYEREKHEDFHEGNKCHTCEQCGKGFVAKGALKTHQLGHNMKKMKQAMELGK